jgi:hypothetical protein
MRQQSNTSGNKKWFAGISQTQSPVLKRPKILHIKNIILSLIILYRKHFRSGSIKNGQLKAGLVR